MLIAYEISLIMPRHLVSEQLHQHSQYYVCVDSQSYGSCSLERLKKEGSWTTLGLEFNMQLVESLRYLTCGVGCPFCGMVMGKRTTKPKNSMSQPVNRKWHIHKWYKQVFFLIYISFNKVHFDVSLGNHEALAFVLTPHRHKS